MLERGVVIANGKGGVGKSSIAAGLAATAAGMGWRTLVVDLDPQANVGQDLGYTQAGLSDDGEGLLGAYVGGGQPTIVEGVRERLDVICGGPATDDLIRHLFEAHARRGAAGLLDLRDVLVAVGSGYDLVVIDTPPTTSVVLDVAFATGHFLCCPVRFDRGSIDGLRRVGARYRRIRDDAANPGLELLGVALFGFSRHERRMLADTLRQLDGALDEPAHPFTTYIREAKKAAAHMRTHGVVASEYFLASQESYRLAVSAPGAETFARNAEGLAEDYWELSSEVLTRLKQRLAAGLVTGAA